MLARLFFVVASLVLSAACTSSNGGTAGSGGASGAGGTAGGGGEPGGACPQAEGLIADGVARFSPEGVDCEEIPRSMALLRPMPPTDEIPADWPTRPTLSMADDRYLATISIEAGTHLYGTGEIAGPLERTGFVTETWTEQPFREEPPPGLSPLEYDDTSPRLYQAHPWVLGVRADGSAFGVFADTTYRTQIDLRNGIELAATAPFPVVVIEGETPQAVLTKLGELTGTIELPPLWALGYQQARWSYYPDSRVREIADEFRARSIPCDVIWMDIDYMDEFRIFTFDPDRFPDPAGLNDYLHDNGFKSVWILDPGVQQMPGFFVYDEGLQGEHFLRYPDGTLFTGRSWPSGFSVWPDYTNPDTRAWWQSYLQDFLANGIDGVWIDLNEPSVISPLGVSFPEELVHVGGGDLPADSHARYHNAYGMLMSRATLEGIKRARPDERPFLLSRSNYLGGQRYSAMWTGDNSASWDHLYWSVTMTLNMGLSGQPFAGPDIGGFFKTPSAGLYAHWIGVGAFFPFSRTHTIQLSADQEPWSFGPEVEAISKAAIERRYRLLPYIYTLFRESSLNGLPIWRPVFFADPADPDLRTEDHAFLLGADVLVVPVLTESDPHEPALPSGIWREFTLVGEDTVATPELPVLKLRGGAILPVGRVVQSTTEALLEPLTLIVSLDANGRAQGLLYEDDGEGYDYEDGDYLFTTYAAEQMGDQVIVRVQAEEGNRERPGRTVNVTVITDEGTFEGSGFETEGVTVELSGESAR
jgi:alpha-glucosidase